VDQHQMLPLQSLWFLEIGRIQIVVAVPFEDNHSSCFRESVMALGIVLPTLGVVTK
jgi:hypothetical protein